MEIVIYVYNGFTAFDAVGSYEVLSRLPNANVNVVGERKGTSRGSQSAGEVETGSF
jgi:hypothetical protein